MRGPHGPEVEMAECVSCGKPVEAGKLFCDRCYARMKGRRVTLREAGGSRDGAEETKGPSREEEGGGRTAVFPAEVRVKRDTLTPDSEKKVVRLRPEMERPSRMDRRRRFTITITFSERTYRMLSRLRPGKESTTGMEEEERPTSAGTAPRKRRKPKGPHGRPALRALEGKAAATRGPSASGGGFAAWVAFRPRRLDGGDLASLGMAALSVACILGLTFLPWVRMTWMAADGTVAGETFIRGSDLGTVTYLALAVVLAAAAYVPLSLWLRERLGCVDFGVVLLLAALAFIIIFYVNISSNQRMVDVALRLAAASGGAPAEDLQRHTTWTAYLVSFMGMLLAFSGLARLSERREPEAGKEKGRKA